ncbi:MAG TPA: TM2 domain-containing protein [Candidatus Pygmaiobacter gallistercoris]|nr:TM2 domain-containing protein [Candidatus Pygmaiobacter gallistercoris]
MFCKNCGHPLAPTDSVCPVCGTPAASGSRFCAACGHPCSPDSVFCPNCGTRLAASAPPRVQSKSRLAAGLLGIFLGGLGIHNFYLGYNDKGICQIILFVLCCGVPSSIWGFIEGILILCGEIRTDAEGNPLSD